MSDPEQPIDFTQHPEEIIRALEQVGGVLTHVGQELQTAADSGVLPPTEAFTAEGRDRLVAAASLLGPLATQITEAVESIATQQHEADFAARRMAAAVAFAAGRPFAPRDFIAHLKAEGLWRAGDRVATVKKEIEEHMAGQGRVAVWVDGEQVGGRPGSLILAFLKQEEQEPAPPAPAEAEAEVTTDEVVPLLPAADPERSGETGIMDPVEPAQPDHRTAVFRPAAPKPGPPPTSQAATLVYTSISSTNRASSTRSSRPLPPAQSPHPRPAQPAQAERRPGVDSPFTPAEFEVAGRILDELCTAAAQNGKAMNGLARDIKQGTELSLDQCADVINRLVVRGLLRRKVVTDPGRQKGKVVEIVSPQNWQRKRHQVEAALAKEYDLTQEQE